MAANIMWDLPKRSLRDIDPFAYALNRYNDVRKTNTDIQKQQLENQYYPSDIQSQIALRNEQRRLEKSKADIEGKKAEHPYMYAPTELAPYLYFGEQKQQQQQAQSQTAPGYGPMTLTNGKDLQPPHQQLAAGLANNAPAQNADNIDLNDPLTI